MKYLRKLASSLAFQSIAPAFFLLLLFTVGTAGVTYQLLARFSELQFQVNNSNEASETLLRIEQNRSRIRETVLMIQANGQTNAISQLEELESVSIRERRHLRELMEFIASRPAQIESFFAGSLETRALRGRIRDAWLKGDKIRAAKLIDSYLVLYRINSARLEDLQRFLGLHVRTKQTQMAELLRALPWYLVALFCLQLLLTAGFIVFHRRTVLFPLKAILRGMESVANGNLDEKIPQGKGPSEVRDMSVNFNVMTSMLQKSNQELQQALARAELSAKAKSEFLSNMSHEIRTPMSAILGFTDVLRDRTLPEKERQDALSRVERSGRTLLRLIDDILDVSKVESGKISIERLRFSPIEVISEVSSLLRLQAEQKGVQLTTRFIGSVPEIAHSDPTRVRQILTNLIGNAIKFTKKGTVRVEVEAETDSFNNRHFLIFRVSDTGIGISEKDQEKLFHPFAQADESITRQFGGTGLGLVLSKRLAQQLGGDLILSKSKLGEGSVFTATIEAGPFDNFSVGEVETQEEHRLVVDANPEKSSLSFARILVVDDVGDNQLLMRRYLESAGADVDIASDGEEAISKAMNRRYDVVLMDIQMPHVDGIQATKRLREQGYGRPILALTAHAMKEERDRSIEAGCDDHLTKPVTKKVLISAVSNYIGKHSRDFPSPTP